MNIKPVSGFSKWSKQAKIEWLANAINEKSKNTIELIESYWHNDSEVQKLHDEFAENTITNFFLPFGVAPNFLLNGKLHVLPMAIEESSVVAAASKAANFWIERGGFKTHVVSTIKIGHVHFIWNGEDAEKLNSFFNSIKTRLFEGTSKITSNMQNRGGGILDFVLLDKRELEPGYFQIEATFDTCDSMGANFINSVLEESSRIFKEEIEKSDILADDEKEIQVVMCILSNYTPQCIVKAEVSCKVSDINEGSGIDNLEFAEKFCRAIRIAKSEPYRAVTHNKGIMNGIDSVILATGNDFRATEACAHAYAVRSGKYMSLTDAEVTDGVFRFWIEIPIAVGTVGGITDLHPLVKLSHKILGNPSAKELMEICAVAGLAQNFSAIRSLVTTGIQKGHMKMHLLNILNQLEATEEEKSTIVHYFKDHVVSHNAAVDVFNKLRGGVELVPLDKGKESGS